MHRYFRIKFLTYSEDNCERLVRNIENARSIIESGSNSKINQLYEKMRGARKQNPNLTYPEIFLDILLDGVNINLNQKEKLDICRAARDFTNNNLDQNMKERVTQSNLVEIKKGNEFYKKKSRRIVVPAVNIFVNKTFINCMEKNIRDKKYNNSLCRAYDCAVGRIWYYGFRTRILFRICGIVFILPVILVYSILYVIYFCKLKYALYFDIRNYGAEYNKLQE